MNSLNGPRSFADVLARSQQSGRLNSSQVRGLALAFEDAYVEAVGHVASKYRSDSTRVLVGAPCLLTGGLASYEKHNADWRLIVQNAQLSRRPKGALVELPGSRVEVMPLKQSRSTRDDTEPVAGALKKSSAVGKADAGKMGKVEGLPSAAKRRRVEGYRLHNGAPVFVQKSSFQTRKDRWLGCGPRQLEADGKALDSPHRMRKAAT